MLNAQTPIELAACCPWLFSMHAIDLNVRGDGAMDEALVKVPRNWDWVIQEPRRRHENDVRIFGQLARLAVAADSHYHCRFTGTPEYLPEQSLRLQLPQSDLAQVQTMLEPDAVALCVMPSGGGPRHRYPSKESWILVLRELRRSWPHAAIVILGKTPGPDGRRASAIAKEEAAQLVDAGGAINGYDLPLLLQLALVQGSRLFVSPHTGFGFAALCVGTPWLTISGGPWFEYFHNGIPFHSLIPDTTRFPAYHGMDGSHVVSDDDGSGPRDSSMTRQRIVETLPELLDSAAILINRQRSYEECLATYFPQLLKAVGGDPQRLNSWEGVHRRYV